MYTRPEGRAVVEDGVDRDSDRNRSTTARRIKIARGLCFHHRPGKRQSQEADGLKLPVHYAPIDPAFRPLNGIRNRGTPGQEEAPATVTPSAFLSARGSISCDPVIVVEEGISAIIGRHTF